MFAAAKTAALIALPLAANAAVSPRVAEVRTILADVKTQMSEHIAKSIAKIPEKYKATGTTTTDDATDAPRASNSIWVGSAVYLNADECAAGGSPVTFSGGDFGQTQGCHSLTGDDDYGFYSYRADCQGDSIVFTGYAGSGCSGEATEVTSMDFDTCEDVGGGMIVSSYCYFNQGSVWKSEVGYTDMTFSTSECPTGCATPLDYTTAVFGSCWSMGGMNFTMTNCDSTEGTYDYNYFDNNMCDGEPIDTEPDTFESACFPDLTPDDDYTEYEFGKISTQTLCTADAPSACGNAMHNGVSFGLTGLLVAASFYFAK